MTRRPRQRPIRSQSQRDALIDQARELLGDWIVDYSDSAIWWGTWHWRNAGPTSLVMLRAFILVEHGFTPASAKTLGLEGQIAENSETVP